MSHLFEVPKTHLMGARLEGGDEQMAAALWTVTEILIRDLAWGVWQKDRGKLFWKKNGYVKWETGMYLRARGGMDDFQVSNLEDHWTIVTPHSETSAEGGLHLAWAIKMLLSELEVPSLKFLKKCKCRSLSEPWSSGPWVNGLRDNLGGDLFLGLTGILWERSVAICAFFKCHFND